MLPSWSVVATVDEPAALVVAFVLHHLEIGAASVDLFLDGPNPEAQAALGGIAEVRVTLCDDAFWTDSTRKKKPKLHTGRQITNANLAYGRAPGRWLLHCDCDEFVRDGQELVAELANTAPRHQYLRLAMAERVETGPETDGLFAGVFRTPFDNFAEVGPQIYGDLARFLKDGVTGHKAGKALVRTGLDLKMGIHSPEGPPPHRTANGVRLLHFDGLTRLHYMIKLLRRAHEPQVKAPPRHGLPRTAQFEQVRGLIGQPEDAANLVRQLKELTAGQLAELRALGALDERPFQPLGANPLAEFLTVAAMDRSLRARYRDFLAGHAPGLLNP